MKKPLVALMLTFLAASVFPESFISQVGRFSVTTPVTLTEEQQEVNGTFTMYEFYGYSEENTLYLITYMDYPRELVATKGLLKQLGDQLLDDIDKKAVVVLDMTPTVEGAPERAIVARVYDGRSVLQSRFIIIKSRVYNIVTINDQGKDSDEVTEFIDTFKVER